MISSGRPAIAVFPLASHGRQRRRGLCIQCLRSSGATNAFISDTNTPLPVNGRAGPWSLLMGIRMANLTQSALYFYLEGVGGLDGVALIWEFVGNTVEVFAPNASGTSPRTNSGITIADTNWHVIGYTYAGAGGEYAKWLDGTKTVINSTITFTFPGSLTQTNVLGRNAASALAGDMSFLYEWSSVQDLAAISADPWAMFATAAAGPSPSTSSLRPKPWPPSHS